MEIPSKGKHKLLPIHKDPHFARPFRLTLCQAFCTDIITNTAMLQLLTIIREGKYKPFFDQSEIDGLFRNEILAVYAKGRYLSKNKLDTRIAWDDLVRNMVNQLYGTCSLIKSRLLPTPLVQSETIAKQQAMRRMKIIEDWIFYHPEEQEKLLNLYSGE